MTEPGQTAARVWKQMTSEQRLNVARAFWRDEEAGAQHMQAVRLIAQQRSFRPKTVASLDEERRTQHLAKMAALPDALVVRALVAYHMTEQRPMMGVFLDALGMVHNNGLIEQDDVKPDPQKVGPAAERLARQFPQEQVRLYLNTLSLQDPETWSALADILQRT